MKERIKLNMNTMEAVLVMAEGNPGAASVLAQLIKDTPTIDPDAAMGPIINVLALDDLGIYGSRIWMLYKDVCGQDIGKVIGLLRGRQLGFLPKADLNHAIDNYGENVDVDAVIAKVQKELPKFNLERNV